jgi:hypothetical protein
MVNPVVGTVVAVELLVAVAMASPATASPIAQLNRPHLESKAHATAMPFDPCAFAAVSGTSSMQPLAGDENRIVATQRPTTPLESLVGEIRQYAIFEANWDGEGAAAPNARALREAEKFVRLLDPDLPLPEPMLHSSGNAGLFWRNPSLYADLEFLGGGRIAYFIKRNGDRHKGVLTFDSKSMPSVFSALVLVS